MKQYIRKADIILFIVLVVTGLAVSAALAMHGAASGAGAKVVIKSGGSVFATYSLTEDRSVVVPAPKQAATDSYNVVTISDGSVAVSEASCKNQVCVRRGSISMPGESIVCLPNRLVVAIEGGSEGGGYDTVTS